MNNPSTTNDIPLLTAPFLHYIPTSPPSQELDFHLPSRTPLHGLTVSEWAGSKSTRYQLQNDTIHSTLTNTTTTPPTSTTTNIGTTSVHITNTTTNSKPIVLKDSNEDNWRDVYRNIKCMDQLYDASFYSWLKSEENVLVTAMYLHRIANEYPLVRIINALKWLISDWRLESISTLVKHVTVDWCDEAGDLRRAHLLRHLTHSWATQYTTTLITMVLSSAPYATTSSFQRERFLREFTKEWDFSKLSEFFMYLQSPANIDYKVKCVMLQEAARRERETLGAKLKKKRVQQHDLMDHSSTTHNTTTTMNSSTTTTTTTIVSPSLHTSLVEDTTTDSTEEAATSRRHHRRTSSNDVNDIKRLRLSTPDLIDHSTTTTESSNSGLCEPLSTQPSQLDLSSSSSPLSSSSSSSSSMSSELSHLHLDLNGSNTNSCTNHHHHHHHHHTPSSSQDIQLRRRTSSNASLEDPMDMDYNSRKRTSGPSSSSYFTTTTDEAL